MLEDRLLPRSVRILKAAGVKGFVVEGEFLIANGLHVGWCGEGKRFKVVRKSVHRIPLLMRIRAVEEAMEPPVWIAALNGCLKDILRAGAA